MFKFEKVFHNITELGNGNQTEPFKHKKDV